MKMCSDALKELFRQYRAGERRTWNIADLYTIWINNSERIENLLGWRQFDSKQKIYYREAKFGLGIYEYRRESEIGYPLIRTPCPPMEIFNWNDNDWTIEFFVCAPSDEEYAPGIPSIGALFTVTDMLFYDYYLPNNGLNSGFAITANELFPPGVDSFNPNSIGYYLSFYTILPGEEKQIKAVKFGFVNPVYEKIFAHVAISKKGKKLYGGCNGEISEIYTLGDDERLFIPVNSYMNFSYGDDFYYLDEVRVSTCARYTGNISVPTEPFTPDADTLSLLHLNGNINDEGSISNGYSWMRDFRSGKILLYTGHDTDLTCGGNLYRHIPIAHGNIEESRGTETATMDLTINYTPTDTISPDDDTTWFRAFKDGVFDKAYISVDRLYSPILWQYNMPNISTDYVLKARFFGRMDVQEVKINSASIQVKSPSDMLTRELPRNLVKPSCLNHFGDFMCQINADLYKADVVAQAGSTRNNIVIESGYIDGTFDNGIIYCTSGANNGQRSSIKSFANNTVVVYKPFQENITAGDKFYVLRGCDKTMKTCENVYGNLVHFRGFPFMPCKNVLL